MPVVLPAWQTAGMTGRRDSTAGVAVSLFSGAGGLDLGVELAGYQVRAAVERYADATLTMEKNFPHLASAVIKSDILAIPTSDIMRAAGLRRAARPDLLVGGPPCTPFSKSGFWLDWKRSGLDPEASLLQAYTRVLREAQPRKFILENVYALTFGNQASKGAYDRLLREIDQAGYNYRAKVLNAADYGVAQSRPRLFVIGARKDEPQPEHPAPSHGGSWERRATGNPDRPHVTSGEALDGLVTDPEPEEVLRGRYRHLLADIPPGDNYLYYTVERGHPDPQFAWRSRFWSFLLKLDPARPSPTIQAQPGSNVGPFHWTNRRLRLAELKRLFTFPDDFDFVGSRASAQYMIGNSVPPQLAQRVAEAVRDA